MGLVRRFRLGRKPPNSKPENTIKLPPAPSAIDITTNSTTPPSDVTLHLEGMERRVEPLVNYAAVGPARIRVSNESGRANNPSLNSSRTSIFYTSSKLKRLFREKILRKRNRMASLGSRSEKDVPESDSISEEEARATEQPAAKEDFSFDANGRRLAPPVGGIVGSDIGKFAQIGEDMQAGDKVNDGYVSFTVPSGWTACRNEDCFYLFNGSSVGYVRSVAPKDVANALLETERLQIVAHVSAVSSPVFGLWDDAKVGKATRTEYEGPPFMEVDYYSNFGGGKGMAVFTNGFDSGACVFALCGPRQEMAMIFRSMLDLSGSTRLIDVRSETRKYMHDVPTLDDAANNGTEAPEGQCTIQ